MWQFAGDSMGPGTRENAVPESAVSTAIGGDLTEEIFWKFSYTADDTFSVSVNG